MSRSLICNVRLVLLAPLLLIGAPMVAPTPAAAQNYNANCGKITDEVHNAELDTSKLNPIMQLLIEGSNKACELINRLRHRNIDPDRVDIDIGDVVEAAKPQPPASSPQKPRFMSEQRWKSLLEDFDYRKRNPNWEAEAKLTRMKLTNAANDTPPENLPCSDKNPCSISDDTSKDPGQTKAIFVANDPKPGGQVPTKVSEVSGDGTLVKPGEIERGTFDKGELIGTGEEVSTDGTWRGGDYKDGGIEGQGFEVNERDGKQYIVTGNFADDRPDGTALTTYSDGSSQYVAYKDGAPVAWGPMAPPDQTPVKPDGPQFADTSANGDSLFDRQKKAYGGTPAADGAVGDRPSNPTAPVVLTRSSASSGSALVSTGIEKAEAWNADRPAREAREKAEQAERYRRYEEAEEHYRATVARVESQAERDRQGEADGGEVNWGGLLLGAAQAYVATRQAQNAYVPPPAPTSSAPHPSTPSGSSRVVANIPQGGAGSTPGAQTIYVTDPSVSCVSTFTGTSYGKPARYFRNNCSFGVALFYCSSQDDGCNRFARLDYIDSGSASFNPVSVQHSITFVACRNGDGYGHSNSETSLEVRCYHTEHR